MKTIIFVGLVVAGIFAVVSQSNRAAAQDVERDRFSGTYTAIGTGNKGNPYQAAVRISRDGEVYKVHWEIGNGDAYDGVGIATGNVLSVGWQLKESAGVAVYEFTEHKITGRWSLIGAQNQYSEELTSK